jgi:6-phosphogluconolactonase
MNKAKEAICSGKVDVLTLAPIHLPDEGIENFARLAIEHNPRMRVTVQEFWLPFDIYDTTFKQRPATVDHNAPTAEMLRELHAPYFKSMDEHVAELNKKLGTSAINVVPVGQAVIALREKIIAHEAPGLEKQSDLFTDPIGHATAPLQALVAYCHFASIYKRSPVGLPMPTILAAAKNPKWDDKLNRLLQEIAWEAVTMHPQSGVTKAGGPAGRKATTYLYVSMAPEQKIQIFRLDPADGKLSPAATVSVDGTPGALSLDPAQRYLFASLRSISTLASYRIDPATAGLTPISAAALPQGENAAHLATDRSGRWLFSASYAAGKVVVHRVREDGTIETPSVQTVETAKTAHFVAVDRANEMVLVPHVAPNAVFQFRFDAKSGMLAAVDNAPGGAKDAGPRHLAFHPTKNLAFTSNEQGSSITAYEFQPGVGLKPLQTLSTLPADFEGQNTTAEVKVHPSGKFAWVSNRGHDSLAGFSIDESGTLAAIGQTPTEKTPRSFDIEPDGRYLFGAGEGSGKLAAYMIDPESGALTRIATYDVGQSLTWVRAVKFSE